MLLKLLMLLTCLILNHVLNCAAQLGPPFNSFDWLIGRWRSESEGTVHWPTIPTMTFSETLDFWPAEVSSQSGEQIYLNYTAIATSHNSGDHFHNEYGYMTLLPSGEVKLFGIGNNAYSTILPARSERLGISVMPSSFVLSPAFATVEKGNIGAGTLELESESVDRLVIAREIPTSAIKRKYTLVNGELQFELGMRTITHPEHDPACEVWKTCPLREHARNVYRKVLSLSDFIHDNEINRRRIAEEIARDANHMPNESTIKQILNNYLAL